jgi:DNA-binding NarL/FixJ family response regulator
MASPKKQRILVVDDHEMVREGLRSIFESVTDLTVCGEAENAEEALTAAEKLLPDVAIVDISLGRKSKDGIELTRQLQQKSSPLPVLMISMHEEQAYIDAARSAGARGYVTKGVTSEGLIDAVRQVLRGESFFSKLAPN